MFGIPEFLQHIHQWYVWLYIYRYLSITNTVRNHLKLRMSKKTVALLIFSAAALKCLRDHCRCEWKPLYYHVSPPNDSHTQVHQENICTTMPPGLGFCSLSDWPIHMWREGHPMSSILVRLNQEPDCWPYMSWTNRMATFVVGNCHYSNVSGDCYYYCQTWSSLKPIIE